jgi:hypothetical protein
LRSALADSSTSQTGFAEGFLGEVVLEHLLADQVVHIEDLLDHLHFRPYFAAMMTSNAVKTRKISKKPPPPAALSSAAARITGISSTSPTMAAQQHGNTMTMP